MINTEYLDMYAKDWAYDASINLLSKPEITNEQVINQSIEMILATTYGSRLFNLSFGSNFSLKLFSNMTMANLEDFLDDTVSSIERFEDRITIIKQGVSLVSDISNGTVRLTIPYVIKPRNITGEFSKLIKS